ncbi:Beta-lactamase [Lachnospiraceae bacterium]|nr:Beta-lactamase [Lachnospiraceae bacterium]
MNRKIRNGLVIAGFGTFGILGVTILVANVRKADDGLRVYAAQTASDADETTINGWESEVDNTIYCTGSVSKVYVTAAVMQLVDQGKVDLDAPVTDYIDDFKMADERYKDITVRMLMNHSSGLMGTVLKDDTLINDNVLDREKLMLTNLATQHLKADPGAYSSYCNDGFDLLEIIVERVSGMDYTTYVEKNIADKIGATSIGTSDNMFENENLVDIYSNEKCYGNEYCLDFGAGGIVSNAKDTCEFGSTFFKGDSRLLSEKCKDEMNTLSTASPYSFYGLGWDEVSIKQYEDAGVKVLCKGGDTLNQHANLMVAPDEEISVCVTTSGGSSGYNKAVCEALMNIALEEQGIEIDEVTAPEVEFKNAVPEEFKKYEGYYASPYSGVIEVTFPDMKYMLLKTGTDTTSESYFKYTDNGFVRVKGDIEADNVKVDPEYTCYRVEEINGGIYIVADMISNNSDLVNNENTTIVAEMMAPNPVSENVINAWKERENQKYAITSDKYSSAIYDTPFVEMTELDGSGYIMVNMTMGVRILRIEDENTASFYTTIPGDASRDMFDMTVNDDGTVVCSNGYSAIPVEVLDKLTKDVTKVALKTDEGTWFGIDDSLANTSISVDRPENSAVFVYDKYGDVIYSSHMKGYGDTIPLPKGGYIAFLGEDGGTVAIKYE